MVLLQLVINGLAAGSLYALVAVGFAIIFNTTRIFHIAHGATYLLAGYTYYYLVAVLGAPPLVGLVAAVLAAVAFGMAVQRWIYRPMQRSEASFLTVFVASFGVIIVLENLIVLALGSGFSTIQSPLSKGVAIGPLVVPPVSLLAIAIAAALYLGLQAFLTRTRTGVVLQAMADSADLVETIGLDRDRSSRIAFILGSALAVPSSVLILYLTGLEPTHGHMIAIIAVASTIVGGIGSLPGTALGALLLGLAENVGIWQLPSSWKAAIAFGLLLVFLIIRPTGLIGQPVRR